MKYDQRLPQLLKFHQNTTLIEIEVIKFEILLVLTCKMKTGPFFFGAHLILIDMYARILPDITNLIYIFFTVTTEQMERKLDRNSSFYTKNNFLYDHKIFWNCIGGVMDWVFVKPDFKIGICCFSATGTCGQDPM